jgi:hypothetical protein
MSPHVHPRECPHALASVCPAYSPSCFSLYILQRICPLIFSRMLVPAYSPACLSPHTLCVCLHMFSRVYVPECCPTCMPPHVLLREWPRMFSSVFHTQTFQAWTRAWRRSHSIDWMWPKLARGQSSRSCGAVRWVRYFSSIRAIMCVCARENQHTSVHTSIVCVSVNIRKKVLLELNDEEPGWVMRFLEITT